MVLSSILPSATLIVFSLLHPRHKPRPFLKQSDKHPTNIHLLLGPCPSGYEHLLHYALFVFVSRKRSKYANTPVEIDKHTAPTSLSNVHKAQKTQKTGRKDDELFLALTAKRHGAQEPDAPSSVLPVARSSPAFRGFGPSHGGYGRGGGNLGKPNSGTRRRGAARSRLVASMDYCKYKPGTNTN